MICFILLAGSASAQTATAKPHKKAQHAHEHGCAKLNIAIDGKEATIELETPADGIVGFEHAAVSVADKKQQSTALDTLKNRIAEMIVFDRSAACTFTARSVAVEQDPDEDHSDVKAEFGVTCGKPPAGTTLRFGFSKVFPRIVDVEVQLLSASQQTGAKIHNDGGTIALSR
jgi:hypothetical protein